MVGILAELNAPLFSGIRTDDLQGMLGCTGYHRAQYKKGEALVIHRGL